MSSKQLKEALVSIAVGVIIYILTEAIEILKQMDLSQIDSLVSSVSGSAWYAIKRVIHIT